MLSSPAGCPFPGWQGLCPLASSPDVLGFNPAFLSTPHPGAGRVLSSSAPCTQHSCLEVAHRRFPPTTSDWK